MKRIAAILFFSAAIIGSFLFAAYTLMLPINLFAADLNIAESFETYTVGDNLGGLADGSGWAAAWQGTGQKIFGTSCNSGLRCVAKGTGQQNYRTFTTSMEYGEMVLWAKRVSAESGSCNMYVGDGSTIRVSISGFSGGDWTVWQDGGRSSMGASVTNDTWTKFTINWDTVNHENQFRYKINDSTYSTWKVWFGSGTSTALSRLTLGQDGDWLQGCAWDDISSIAPPPPATTTPPTATTTFSDYDGVNTQEWLFVACTMLFFVSYASWGRIFVRP